MRILTLILSVLGLYWALLSLYFLIAPFAVLYFSFIGDHSEYFPGDESVFFPLLVILPFCNAALGYWIWSNWIHYAFKREFYKVTTSRLWGLSIINHGLWLLLIPPLQGGFALQVKWENPSTIIDWYFEAPNIALLMWPICIGILSLFFYWKARTDQAQPT